MSADALHPAVRHRLVNRIGRSRPQPLQGSAVAPVLTGRGLHRSEKRLVRNGVASRHRTHPGRMEKAGMRQILLGDELDDSFEVKSRGIKNGSNSSPIMRHSDEGLVAAAGAGGVRDRGQP